MSSQKPPTRITVLISGNGTNLQALIDDKDHKLASSTIVRVISNRKSAFGLTRAQKANIPIAYHNLVTYKKKHSSSSHSEDEAKVAEDKAREEYDQDLAKLVLEDCPDLVVCAGFMHILKPAFLDPLGDKGVKIINLHPALPGKLEGANAIERAHDQFMSNKITETGIMIHYVIEAVDQGEPLLVVPIPLSHPEDDDIEALKERIHAIEHPAIVEGTRMAVEKLWKDRGQ